MSVPCRLILAVTILALTWPMLPKTALAGGGPQNVLVVIDPTDADALRVANHYIAARGIPAANVFYLSPTAAEYGAFTSFQLPGVLGTLKQRGLEDSIDYVVTAGQAFYVSAPGLVDALGCPGLVTRFSTSGAWSLAPVAGEILAGQLDVSEPNDYYANDDTPLAFDASNAWRGGRPSTSTQAHRYLLGFQLGYSGERGNSPEETIAMIDRSVRSDGTHPQGTFYFMRNGDVRSTTRSPYFQTAIDGLQRLGGKGEIVDGLLPDGKHDVLGLLAGSSNLDIAGADLTLLPGAWADHVTSFAATFDEGGQTKLSPWIPKGASGSMGTVEEPCVFQSSDGYYEKFPHPRITTFYYAGLSLGEALFRSTPFAPFQALFYGDPLTRPFAYIPTVTVADAPTAAVQGVLVLHPAATTTRPNTAIARFDLFADGQQVGSAEPGKPLWVDTHRLPDGPRELRVVAYDDSPAQVQGAWQGTIEVRNQAGRTVKLTSSSSTGHLMTLFHAELSATGGDDLVELRLRQHGRVLAATQDDSATFDLDARLLGAGASDLVAEALYRDEGLVTSAPVRLTIAPTLPDPIPPVAPEPATAYSYIQDVLPGQPLLFDLPALAGLTGRPDSLPGQAQQGTVVTQGAAYLLWTNEAATGVDQLEFRATGAVGEPSTGAVTLRYCAPAVITKQPEQSVGCFGRRVVLQVEADDAMAYQWYQDGEPIVGAVGPQYEISSVQSNFYGKFYVIAARRCGAAWMETRSVEVVVGGGDCFTPTPTPGPTPVPGRGKAYLPWAGSGR
jgi:hypothetical protein